MQLLLQNTVRLDVQYSRDNGSILAKVSGIKTAKVQTYLITYQDRSQSFILSLWHLFPFIESHPVST